MMPFLVFVLLFSATTQAQNEGQYTHFMFNRLSYDPAFAGSSGNISATLLYRNQWMGLTLQPSTPGGEAGSTPTNILFSFDMPVSWLHGGIGLTFTSDKYGFHNNNTVAVDYAFRIFWGPGTLAAGVEADLQSYSFETSSLVGSSGLSGQPGGGTSGNDPLISSGDNNSDFLVDVSTGLYYQVPSLYYVGLSVKNLLGSHSETLNLTNNRTVYMMGGYEYSFPYNPSFKLKPSALLKTANFSVFQLDVACLLDYENTFWGGLSYRIGDAINFMAGVHFLQMFRVGVAYDLTTSKLGFGNGRSFGSVEIFANGYFQINVHKKPPTVSGNTLYLR